MNENSDPKKFKIDTGVILGGVGIIISLMSLYLSVSALKITSQQHEERYLPTLIASIDDDERTIKLKPVNENIYLESGYIKFPSELGDTVYMMNRGDFIFKYEKAIIEVAKSFENEHQKWHKQGISAKTFNIPASVFIQFIAHGKRMKTESIYNLKVHIKPKNNERYPAIAVENFIFEKNLSGDVKSIFNQIDKEWDKRRL